MAEESGVQSYLTKHKISSLFEDLMSKVVKELPPDPIDFLIKKLQLLQRRRKKDIPSGVGPSTSPVKGSRGQPSISPAKISRGRIQVTGTSVASKTPTKSPISDRLNKSTSGLQPVKAKSAALSSTSTPSLSKTTPTRPTTATRASSGSKPTSKIPAVSGIRTKPTSRPFSGTSKQGGSGIPVSTKVGPSPVKASPRLSKAASATSSTGKTGAGGKATAAAAKNTKLPSSKAGSEQGSKVSSNQPTGTAPASHQPAPREEVIDDFFGQPKKSSQQQFCADSEEEDEGTGLGGHSDDGSEDGEGMADHVTHSDGGIDLQRILESRRCKHTKKSQQSKRDFLAMVAESSSTSLSLGYDSESGDSSDTGVEVWEDVDALREEGVEVAGHGSGFKRTSAAAVVEMTQEEVMVCARCAQALGKGDQVMLTALEFESASQVGSHASYPQWGSEELGSSSAELHGASERDPETCSDVTLQSHDTWGGLAPPEPLEPQISDEESEIQLPPVPLQGHDWLPQTDPPRTAHGWGQQT